MSSSFQNVKIDTDKIILTSNCQLYKTENFIKQTKYISNVDFFISKLAEGVVKAFNFISPEKNKFNNIECYKIETTDKAFSFLFKFGYQIQNQNVKPKDIIFYNYMADISQIRQNDQRIINYLKTHTIINVSITKTKDLFVKDDFKKLYVISNGSNINLPLLSEQQKQIVEIQDQNVLVQGVAGSGKTNVCIDKLIFSACKSYSGKILYTTFSRGLLLNTKLKIEAYIDELADFVNKFENKKVLFLDDNHKKALENKFGIYFFNDDDDKILLKIKRVINYLSNKIDYFMFDDIYKKHLNGNGKLVFEHYFINDYVKNIKNHHVAKEFKKLEQYSYEIIYKEIYGMIFGLYNLENPTEMLSEAEYIEKRKNSFSAQDCKSIYLIAKDYYNHCIENNLTDNNSISRLLLQNLNKLERYSLAIIDEVQDYTQVNLCAIKSMSLKVFCVGDALQMINPSYFSFAYLKNLLYKKDVISVAELKNNYRNTKKIEEIIQHISDLNTQQFGTHNFVIRGEALDNNIKTTMVYVNDADFIKAVAKGSFDNFTIVVSGNKQKEELRKIIKNQEILTISEIKGLERDTVVLYNVLSDNLSKWNMLEKISLNKKQADENSVYRYYFNLFYVGVSRAKQNLFVVENNKITIFNDLFKQHFENVNLDLGIKKLNEIVSKVEFTETELYERVQEFMRLEQFENARFVANKIGDDKVRIYHLNKIDVYENYISIGRYRDAGIRFWELNMIPEAKEQFTLSGDKSLIELIDACLVNSDSGLNIDIVQYYEDVKNNSLAKNFILETIQKDIAKLKSSFKEINENFKHKKEKKHGK